jgi:hypothetical protein
MVMDSQSTLMFQQALMSQSSQQEVPEAPRGYTMQNGLYVLESAFGT